MLKMVRLFLTNRLFIAIGGCLFLFCTILDWETVRPLEFTTEASNVGASFC